MIILITGFLFGCSLSKFILRVCTNPDINVILSRLFANSIKLLIVLLFRFIASKKTGADISPFIALLSAGALGLSLAIQAPISNYGVEIAIVLTRLFKVHDTLNLHGCTGFVSVKSIASTQLKNEDGQVVTI
tara:strand:+ start:33 stop:428 length:396 start_codon:yes stop_codon:yes gene_type:complete